MSTTEPSVADRSVADSPPAPTGSGTALPVSSATRVAPAVRAPSKRTFPREARLLDKPAYDAVFGDNRRLADRYWTVLVHTPVVLPSSAPPPGEPLGERPVGARLGLAVAKKRARRAVDRNRIKRVARESFRHVRASLGERQVVIMNRDAARDAGAAELRRSLDILWARLLRQSSPGKPPVGGKRVP